MCGIVCYTGSQEATPILLRGLETLEYRGYDSAGIGLVIPEIPAFQRFRAVGPVQRLIEHITKNQPEAAFCGIAHTRWASHGKPSEENAHPHWDCESQVMLVHNGDLEGHLALRDTLIKQGHAFRSETDTEILAHLLEDRPAAISHVDFLRNTLAKVQGTYALGIVFADLPTTIFVTKRSSSVLVGKTSHGTLAASDAPAMLLHTRDVYRLRDGEIAVLHPTGFELFGAQAHTKVVHVSEQLEGSTDELKKDGHPYFMRKEFYGQPDALANVLRGRLDPEHGTAILGGIKNVEERLREVDRIVLTGCGSAYYAGLMGKRFFERFARIPTEVVLANQLPYDTTILTPRTAVISITQSGITADTLEAQREAKRHGALTLGIVNAVGTTIPSENDGGVYLRVGTESCVASTKAFTAQATALALVALAIGRTRGMSLTEGQEVVAALERLEEDARAMLKRSEYMGLIANLLVDAQSVYFLGAGAFLPTALEGALKLKEVAYIHAEAYGTGELKHGPLALVDKDFPVLVLAPSGPTWSQTMSALAKLHSIGVNTIVLSDCSGSDLGGYARHLITIKPEMPALTAPILWTILLQRLAYETAVAKLLDPDRPRHLSKAITVR